MSVPEREIYRAQANQAARRGVVAPRSNRGKKIKCADWLYFAQTIRREHEAHEWWDPCRGIRWCPGVTSDDIKVA